jgi:isoaspartyl peptidase/L-asparaginase-like protein (Ntn-hydrolase superfamily)
MSRRNFLKILGIGGLAGFAKSAFGFPTATDITPNFDNKGKAIVISTWNHGLAANKEAWTILKDGGKALDAVEKGVRDSESDPENTTVGLGGTPDRDGNVTLDACIMDEKGRAGSVAFLQHIENPISVARMVMEKTPHVMLVGDGALRFALENGFKKTNLLTEASKKRWEEWKKTAKYETPINIENHDTIGMLAIDKDGNISGACTTSGLGYKMHGRVGDSPIIGAGLYVDNEVGGAVATGLGELVMRTCGSFLVVENMRRGMSPEKACKAAVERIIAKHPSVEDMQVGFLALRKDGKYGGYSIHDGFDFALTYEGYHGMTKTAFMVK